RLRLAGLPPQEAQQFGVDFFRVCPRDAVWTVFHDQQARPFDELAVRCPAAVMGRMRSASPCITRVGTSMRSRSLRKSSCQVATHAKLAVAEAPAATFQLAWTACSLTRLPSSRSVL